MSFRSPRAKITYLKKQVNAIKMLYGIILYGVKRTCHFLILLNILDGTPEELVELMKDNDVSKHPNVLDVKSEINQKFK
ncbi:4568_t:CDS:2, partial [Gigaspora margarita]